MGTSLRQTFLKFSRILAVASVAAICGSSAFAQFVIDEEPAAKPAVVKKAAGDNARLQEHLAAGEFGPATALANKANGPQRQQMMQQIALAQIESGEFHGALMSVRQSDSGSDESKARSNTKPNNAGGSAADFTELTNLIQTQTDGLWADIDGDGGTMSQFSSGVMADPTALLPVLARVDTEGRLASLGLKARQANLNAEMARSSKLRMVSFNRIRQAVEQNIQDGTPIPETLRNMAGLTSVKYVFTDEVNHDILIGGPASAWMYNADGQPVSAETGRPTLRLDDLVTVLRTFSDSGRNEFICSIDPRQDGLQRLQAYVKKSNSRGSLTPRQTFGFVKALQRNLGMQDVSINGVPEDSRIARVIFEADYRMKLIGIGKLNGVDGMMSFFDLLPKHDQKNPPAIDALRWWLTMNYDSILHSPNKDVFEIAGSSVKCQSENEFLTDQGKRVSSGGADAVNKEFADRFTKHYSKLAERDIVFADLQNVFDLALVAALIRHEGLDRQVGFQTGEFAANGAYQTQKYEPTREIMSVVNHRVYNGKDIVVQVAGGVRGDVMKVAKDHTKKKATDLRKVEQSTTTNWWWDSK